LNKKGHKPINKPENHSVLIFFSQISNFRFYTKNKPIFPVFSKTTEGQFLNPG
jgi:hypothetical protein